MSQVIKQKIQMELEMNGLGPANAGINGLASASGTAEGKVHGLSGAMASGAIQAQLITAAVNLAKEAVRAFTDYLIESSIAAVDAGETWNKFSVVFGDNTDDVNSRLETLATNTNNSIYGLRDLTAGIQDMLVPMGLAKDVASDLSVNFTELALDMASFNNARVDDTLNAITSALAGQSRPLRQYGVDTRVAALEAQALEMGIHGTWIELDQATQAQVLYAKIVADTADAQGDAARTADEAQGTLRGLRVMWEDGAVTVGEYFIPVIEELVPMLKDELADALPVLQQIAERIANDMLKYGPIAIEVMGAVVDVVGFLVDHYNDLGLAATTAGIAMGGPLGAGIGLVIDLIAKADDETRRFNEKLAEMEGHVIRNRIETYEYAAAVKGLTAAQVEANVELGKAIPLFEWASDAQIEMGIATGEATIAMLNQLSALPGMENAYDSLISQTQAQIDKLHTLSKTVGEMPEFEDEATGGTATPTQPETPELPVFDPMGGFAQAMAMQSKMAGVTGGNEMAQGFMEAFTSKSEEMAAAFDEAMGLEHEAWERRYNLAMDYTTDMTNMFLESWESDFNNLDEMFEQMVKNWSKQLVASGILSAFSSVFGGGPVGLFGQLLGGGE